MPPRPPFTPGTLRAGVLTLSRMVALFGGARPMKGVGPVLHHAAVNPCAYPRIWQPVSALRYGPRAFHPRRIYSVLTSPAWPITCRGQRIASHHAPRANGAIRFYLSAGRDINYSATSPGLGVVLLDKSRRAQEVWPGTPRRFLAVLPPRRQKAA